MCWHLVCYDISFLWERIGFLSNQNDDILVKVPFTWIPVPPSDKTKPVNNRESSRMSAFSSMSMMEPPKTEEEENPEVF